MRAKIALALLCFLSIAVAALAAQRVQVLIYKDPGFEGDWAASTCQYGEYNLYPFLWNDLDCQVAQRSYPGGSYSLGYVCEFVTDFDPCPTGYTYLTEGTRGLCIKGVTP